MDSFHALGGVAGLGLAHQLQSSMSTFQTLGGMGIARRLQSSIKGLEGVDRVAGLVATRRLHASMAGFSGIGVDMALWSSTSGLADIGEAARLATAGRVAPFAQGLQASGCRNVARQLQSSMRRFQGTAGGDLIRQLQSSMNAFDGLGTLDIGRQLQSSMSAFSLAGQLGIASLTRGLLGPTATLEAIARLGDGSFDRTKLGELLDHLPRIAEMDADADPDELERTVFDLSAWAALPARVKAWIKVNHLWLLGILIALVYGEYKGYAAEMQAAATAEQVAAISDQVQEHDRQSTEQLAGLKADLADVEGALEQIAAVLQRRLAEAAEEVEEAARSAAVSQDECQTIATPPGVEERMLRRTARVHAHPRSKACVVARVPEGEVVLVFKQRPKWVYIGYPDLVSGRPITGWVLKKYTRRSLQKRQNALQSHFGAE